MSRQLLPTDVADLADLFERIGSVSVRQASALGVGGVTRIYELINNGELESFLDGKSRRITLRSIKDRQNRLLKSGGNTPYAVAKDTTGYAPTRPAALASASRGGDIKKRRGPGAARASAGQREEAGEGSK
jgi:hypothetical protein